jgi:hypothetical protein
MSRAILVISLIVCYYFLSGCTNEASRKQTTPAETNANKNNVRESPQLVKVSTKNNIKSISFDTVTLEVPIQANITPENLYDGIYEFQSDSLTRRKIIILNNLAFITTFEDLGTGYRSFLYVFDVDRKIFIRDSSFNRDYLYSTGGVFVIDANKGKIFQIDKSTSFVAKNEMITPASFYEVKGKYFDFEKSIYRDGELGIGMPADTAILIFYKNATTGIGVHLLPNDW